MLRLKIILIIMSLITVSSYGAEKEAISKDKDKVKKSVAKKKGSTKLSPSIVFLPESIRQEASPGDDIIVKLKAYNGVPAELDAQLVIKDLYTTDSNGVVIYPEKEKNRKKLIQQNSILSNVTIPEKVFKIKHKETKPITFTIKVPENAQGSYYFLYSVQPTKESLLKAKKTHNGMLAFLLNINGVGVITIKNKETHKIEIQAKPSYKADKLIVQTEIINQGNGFLREMAGTAVLLKNTEVLGKIDLLPLGKNPNFMPKTKKMFAGSANLSLVKGDYKILITFQDEKNKHVETKQIDFKVN